MNIEVHAISVKDRDLTIPKILKMKIGVHSASTRGTSLPSPTFRNFPKVKKRPNTGIKWGVPSRNQPDDLIQDSYL